MRVDEQSSHVKDLGHMFRQVANNQTSVPLARVPVQGKQRAERNTAHRRYVFQIDNNFLSVRLVHRIQQLMEQFSTLFILIQPSIRQGEDQDVVLCVNIQMPKRYFAHYENLR
jgi:hypothetical protein